MFTKIVYIHGFNGRSKSPKIDAIRGVMEQEVIAVEYDSTNFYKSIETLERVVQDLLVAGEYPCLVGTSLGGWWAAFLSTRYKLPSLILNPSVNPQETLKDRVVGSDLFHPIFTHTEAPRIVLVEEGDELFDSRATYELFKDKCRAVLLPGGSHQFENFSMIGWALKELENTVV